MKYSKTARGFELIEWQDIYGKSCSLQQSSLAEYEPPGTSAVWLGIDEARMHLDVKQVEWLVHQLKHWLDTGIFDATKND